ncbi:unnamed protein product [Ascophyllum nodosum]
MPPSSGLRTCSRPGYLATVLAIAVASVERSSAFLNCLQPEGSRVSIAYRPSGVAWRRRTKTLTMASPLRSDERVVIVGGGIVGASTAYHLTLRGVKPLVIERSGVACAASGKAGGFLAGGWGNGPTVGLHKVSFDMHGKLAETLGVASYRKIPTLQASERAVNGARSGSSPADWLDGKASGSLMDADTAQVTPLELTTKLMEAALAKGAELRIGTVSGVVSIAASESPGEGAGAAGSVKGTAVGDERRITGVSLDNGEEIPCDKVVVAMGPWSCLAEDWFGIPVPMQGIKSTSIVFAGSEAVARDPYALFCAEDRNGCHLEVYPRPTGEVYLCGLGGSDYVDPPRLKGGGDCEKPEDISPDPSRVAAATKSFRGMTSLGSEGPTVSQACMRPCPPDGLPIMGSVPGFRGAYISAGHNCWGILWGPVTGLLMSELLVDGKASTVNIEPFSPSRFMKKSGRRGRRRGAADLVGEQW